MCIWLYLHLLTSDSGLEFKMWDMVYCLLIYDCGFKMNLSNSEVLKVWYWMLKHYFMIVDYGLCIVDSTMQIVDKDMHCGGQLVGCQLLNSDFGIKNNICGF